MNTYTVIQHKPDSSVSSMSCTVGQWWGEYDFGTQYTENDILKYPAEHLAKELDRGEVGYTVTIIGVVQVPYFDGYDEIKSGEQTIVSVDYHGDIESILNSSPLMPLAKRLSEKVKQIKQDREEAEKKKKAQEKEVAHLATIAREKKQLEELKLKYEQSTHK